MPMAYGWCMVRINFKWSLSPPPNCCSVASALQARLLKGRNMEHSLAPVFILLCLELVDGLCHFCTTQQHNILSECLAGLVFADSDCTISIWCQAYLWLSVTVPDWRTKSLTSDLLCSFLQNILQLTSHFRRPTFCSYQR